MVLVGVAWLASSSALGAQETGSLRIEQAVSLALSRNERARIADLNVTVASAAVDKARTAFLPTLGVAGIYTQKPDDVIDPTKSHSYSATTSAVLSQPLLNAGAFPLYASARRTLDATAAQTTDDKRVLAFDAARAFFTALSAEAVLAAANTRLDTAKANLKDTQDRVAGQFAGTSSNDVTRASIDLANAVVEVENDKGATRVAYVSLAYTINAPIPVHLDPPDAILAAGRQTVPAADGLVRLAIARRPDLQSKRFLGVAAHDFAQEPLLRLVPTLGVSGTFQLSTDETLVGHGFYNTEFVTLTLAWPLFDAGVRYADKRARDAAASIADLTTDELARNVDEQVRAACATLEAAQNALSAAKTAQDAAHKNVTETDVLYKQGLAKAIELVDATDSAFLADVAYVTSEYGVALAYLSLRQAMGLDPLGTVLQ